MIRKALTFCLFLFLINQSFANEKNRWFYSTTMTFSQATIENGVILSKTTNPNAVREQICQQLHFAIGQLNATSSAPALGSTLKIELNDVKPAGEDLHRIEYRATFLVGLGNAHPLSQSVELIIPGRADSEGIQQFYATYVKSCGLAYEEGVDTFFFYFRPDKPTCTVRTDPQAPFIVRIPMSLAPIAFSVPHVVPRYETVWADRTLRATLYFEKTHPKLPSGGDEFYTLLTQAYGTPLRTSTVDYGDFKFVRAFFKTLPGNLDVSIFNITKGNAKTLGRGKRFLRFLYRSMRHSDLIAYNGHSGYGKKVRNFAELVSHYSSNRYKLVYLNGCDTFSYINNSLFKSRTQMDVITTGLAAYVTQMPAYSLQLIQSLIEKKDKFDELLAKIPLGSPALMGNQPPGAVTK
ncbi:MAG: hypothetical protein HY537_04335 [Deltaproteobacteria bacterium]|nr:hypothetical protein [Deltaproteobacteria bacterium]